MCSLNFICIMCYIRYIDAVIWRMSASMLQLCLLCLGASRPEGCQTDEMDEQKCLSMLLALLRPIPHTPLSKFSVSF